MSIPANNLQQVITYNESNLALLQNMYAFISTANKKFNEFDKIPKNLGDTVSFDLPPRGVAVRSLVPSFQAMQQRVQNLTVSEQISFPMLFSNQQFIFNVEDYMKTFGKAAMATIGAEIEKDVAGVCESGTYRFYGDGTTPITTSAQLASALALFRTTGATRSETKGYLSDIMIPSIVNSNANQFTIDRNNAEVMSWMLGDFSGCDWYQSNLLPVHTAGSEGQAGSTLTVVSTTLNTEGGVTSITFSGTSAASDANSIKAYDLFQFNDGVSGKTNLRYLTEYGTAVTAAPVQFAATIDAASTGGSQVTITLSVPLQAASGTNRNINAAVVAGMTVSCIPSHRCGMLTQGNPLYLAMPALPSTEPYMSSVAVDKDSGASIRMYHGYIIQEAGIGNIHDAIWGKTLAQGYGMRLVLPLSQ